MRTQRDGERILVRFEVGERLPEALVELARQNDWTSASLTGIGGVEDVTLAYYDLDQRKYLSFSVDGIVELVSLVGNLSLLNGEPFWHLHAAVAGRDGGVKAGHLIGLKVAITAECWVLTAGLCVSRAHDEHSGLKLLDL